ncbi:probable helicase senataxin isoform X2 [Hoplias malabaricus]|uniref:probable helicase senataxin isoform X2 n=1 Tax=Hoplias malabaricus TaxID=27720 RepID=UPI00346273B4
MEETCRWCRTEGIEAATAILKQYCTSGLTTKEVQEANDDLCFCNECVATYHQARDRLPSLHKRLWELETTRLCDVFREVLKTMKEEDDLCIVEDGQEQPVYQSSRAEFHNRLRYPLEEVLKYPYLLCHQELCDLVVRVMGKLDEMNSPFEVHEKYQGTYLLMVHPNDTVRRWAIDTARSYGRVDRDRYYDLKEVFSRMFLVLELGISLGIPDQDTAYSSGKIQLIPSHLYDSNNEKNYWLGICMLLMQLDSQAMDSLFTGLVQEGSIPQCIMNTMTESREVGNTSSDPFWPALHCFMVILDRLGSKIWCQIEPSDAFDAITKAASYRAEIETIRQQTSGTRVKVEPKSDDDMVACSQIVYNCFPTERTTRTSVWSSNTGENYVNEMFEEMSCLVNSLQSEMGQGMRVYGSTFLWFIPFVRSVMELGTYGDTFVDKVIHYLYEEVDKDVLSGKTLTCDKVTEFFIRIIVDIIKLLFHDGSMRTLNYCAHTWVELVVQCSTLKTCSNSVPGQMGVSFSRGNRNSATAVGGIGQDCMKLICCLLKEERQMGKFTDAAYFYNLLNRHLREGLPRTWDLVLSDSKKLVKCLTKLVEALLERAVASSAPPTPPADPPEDIISDPNFTLTNTLQKPQYRDSAAGPSGAKIKEEPFWNYENDQDPWFDNLEDIVTAKKEPQSPVLISNCGPAPGLSCMKPDLEKIQEIRSILSENQKLQAIVTGKPEEKAEKQNGCSDVKDAGQLPCLSSRDSSSQATISASMHKSSKVESNDVRRSLLKKSYKWSSSESDTDVTDARQTPVQTYSKTMGENHNAIIILDDEVATNHKMLHKEDKSCSGNTAKSRTSEPSLSSDLKSPGLDYDGDLSESQVFEFETQENMPSAWGDPDFCSLDIKCKRVNAAKASTSFVCLPPASGWVEETQPVSDEDIEKACQQAEEQISKQQSQDPRAPVPPKLNNHSEKWDGFIQPKSVLLSQISSKKSGLADKGQQCKGKKSVLIEPLKQKNKCHISLNTMSEKPSSSAASGTHTRGTPTIVPPKKVRKPVEPESVAESMGLKKRVRKALDLSQRSLDTLGELRTHGQNVHVDQPRKRKRRVPQQLKPQTKLTAKGGKKLLASQDMQYFMQSRGMLHKTQASPTLAKPVRAPVPLPPPKLKCAVEEPEDEMEEEDDYLSFLPCSQPDPALKTAQTTEQANIPAKEPKQKHVTFDDKDVDSCQDSKVGDGTCASANELAETGKEDDDEWMQYTQNEPTDMELCSQMEQMEAYHDLNAQREPVDVDMDIQLGTSSAETDLLAKPLYVLGSQNRCPLAPNSVKGREIFLKPGMSQMSQKKAKPSTTKIYAANSRSASLVVEMERAAKPLPVSNACKAKAVRPPQQRAMPPPQTAMQPPVKQQAAVQPAQRQQPMPPPPPPTRSVLKPAFHQLLQHTPCPEKQPPMSVVPNNNVARHPPSYKTYSRPEDPVSVARAAVKKQSQPQCYDQSFLTQAILKWEYHMFQIYENFGPPQDLCSLPLKEVPTRFSSFEEYFSIMYPLLLINAFEEMASEWQRRGRIELELKVQGLEYSCHTAIARFQASLNSQQEMRQLYPKEDDLVLLWLPENTGAYSKYESAIDRFGKVFGCVSRSTVINNGAGQPSTLLLTIQTRGNVSSVDSQSVHCEVISSLVTTMREFRALCLLRSGIMGHPQILLTPHISVFTSCQMGLLDLDMPEYNEDQAKAITCGLAMVKRQERSPKIILIHGPPGTGKSKTIVGLLQRLFSDHHMNPSVNHQNRSRRMRVLLCAPSNAAIDSLMKKVIVVFKEKCRNILTPQGNCGDINLVRLGNEKTICRDLILFSLESQASKKIQIRLDADVQRQKEKLDQAIDSLSRQCAVTHKQSPEFKQLMQRKQHYLSEREKLSRQLKEFGSKRQEIQAGILRDAHVICCTLSNSSRGTLESAFRRLGHEPFSCVIIDEAGQAKETETLIPLLYRCPNLILVGDPEQLPPTVVSMKAKDLGYDQSLMARLSKSLRQSNPHESHSIFLSVQYRMHPDICEFPSKYIYNRNLKNDPETAQKRCAVRWPLEAYRVFDVTDGQESRENDSYSNVKEVKLVLMLLKRIWEKPSMRVGVITPYNAQKQKILQAIKKEASFSLRSVDVDTVDGFQGREMDCIIVSCVRASSEMGSIGFVGNRQRMNVTITRAKFSLFILGHLRTLREHSDWGALINDAGSRGTIIKTQERDFHKAVTKVLKPDRSRPFAPVAQRHNKPTSPLPLAHTNMETTSASSISPTTSGPRDPRLKPRPLDSHLQEPVREQMHDRGRWAPTGHRPQPQRIRRETARRSTLPHSSRSPQRPNHHWSSSSSPERRDRR